MEPLADTDLNSYLTHQRELIILTAIEEAKKEVDCRLYPSCVLTLFHDSLLLPLTLSSLVVCFCLTMQ